MSWLRWCSCSSFWCKPCRVSATGSPAGSTSACAKPERPMCNKQGVVLVSLKKLGLAALLTLAAGLPAAAQNQVVRIGATPGPHAQILEVVKPIAAKKGIDLKIVE